MNKEKYQRLLNNQRFDRITFALDYIRSMKQVTGEIQESDFLACLETLYKSAYCDGQRDILDRYVYTMNHEIDVIEDHFNN